MWIQVREKEALAAAALLRAGGLVHVAKELEDGARRRGSASRAVAIDWARAHHQAEHEIAIHEDADISEGEGGVWVSAWCWVDMVPGGEDTAQWSERQSSKGRKETTGGAGGAPASAITIPSKDAPERAFVVDFNVAKSYLNGHVAVTAASGDEAIEKVCEMPVEELKAACSEVEWDVDAWLGEP